MSFLIKTKKLHIFTLTKQQAQISTEMKATTRISLIEYTLVFLLLFGCVLYANEKEDTGYSNIRNSDILNYSNYIQQTQERIKSLKKTIRLLKNINGQPSAYYFLLQSSTNSTNPYFYVDRKSLTSEEKTTISKLEKQMENLNKEAFNEAKKTCERVVDADGYGSTLLLRYYKKMLNELNCSVPIP